MQNGIITKWILCLMLSKHYTLITMNDVCILQGHPWPWKWYQKPQHGCRAFCESTASPYISPPIPASWASSALPFILKITTVLPRSLPSEKTCLLSLSQGWVEPASCFSQSVCFKEISKTSWMLWFSALLWSSSQPCQSPLKVSPVVPFTLRW